MNKLINAGAINNITSGMKNKLINGNFDIWQRGASQSTAGYGSADRWAWGITSGTFNISQYANGASSYPSSGRYCAVVNGTSLIGGYMYQTIETLVQFSGKTVTLSFIANTLSGTNSGVTPYLRQYFGTGGSPSANVDTLPISSSIVGSKYSYTYNLPSVNGKVMGTTGNDYLQLIIPFTGTFSISIYAIQLEEGNIATTFEQRHIQQELALCQRYYQVLSGMVALVSTATTVNANTKLLPVIMRTSPTVVQTTSGTGATWGVSNKHLFQSGTHSLDAATIPLTLDAEL